MADKPTTHNMHGDLMCGELDCRQHRRLHSINGHQLCRRHVRAVESGIILTLKTEVLSGQKTASAVTVCSAVGCQRANLYSAYGELFCGRHVHKPKRPLKHTLDPVALYNLKGVKLCDAVGCHQVKVYKAHGGMFCHHHIQKLDQIRLVITPHTGSFQEYQARIEELRFRKVWDIGHPSYAARLGQLYN